MKTWSFYHPETGELHGRVFTATDARFLVSNTPEDHVPIEGRYDAHTHHVDVTTGKIIERAEPLRSERPSGRHVWDVERRIWIYPPPTEEELHKRGTVARIAAFADEERHLVRRILVDQDRAASVRLGEIDTEIRKLQRELENPNHDN